MNMEESEQYAAKLIEREQFHEAERLLIPLADQGSDYALMALAWIYENGCIDGKNVKAAQYYYENAIGRGNTEAFLDLALLLQKEGRWDEAQRWLERGVDKGNIGCAAELGWMLAKGNGGDTRRVEGRKMLEEASNQGHLFAQRRMISLELSEAPSLIRRIRIFKRLLVLAWRSFFELYRNRRSEKIW